MAVAEPGRKYRVVKAFKDREGRQWQPTEQFEGDEDAIEEARANGCISETNQMQGGDADHSEGNAPGAAQQAGHQPPSGTGGQQGQQSKR